MEEPCKISSESGNHINEKSFESLPSTSKNKSHTYKSGGCQDSNRTTDFSRTFYSSTRGGRNSERNYKSEPLIFPTQKSRPLNKSETGANALKNEKKNRQTEENPQADEVPSQFLTQKKSPNFSYRESRLQSGRKGGKKSDESQRKPCPQGHPEGGKVDSENLAAGQSGEEKKSSSSGENEAGNLVNNDELKGATDVNRSGNNWVKQSRSKTKHLNAQSENPNREQKQNEARPQSSGRRQKSPDIICRDHSEKRIYGQKKQREVAGDTIGDSPILHEFQIHREARIQKESVQKGRREDGNYLNSNTRTACDRRRSSIHSAKFTEGSGSDAVVLDSKFEVDRFGSISAASRKPEFKQKRAKKKKSKEVHQVQPKGSTRLSEPVVDNCMAEGEPETKLRPGFNNITTTSARKAKSSFRAKRNSSVRFEQNREWHKAGGEYSKHKMPEEENVKYAILVVLQQSLFEKNTVIGTEVADYLTKLTGFKLDGSLITVRENNNKKELMVSISCSSEVLAKGVICALNEVAPEVGLKATLFESDDLFIDEICCQIESDAQSHVTTHHAKSAEVTEQLRELEDKQQKWVTMDEYEKKQEIRKPLKSKLSELELQEKEFCKYTDKLLDTIRSMKASKEFKKQEVLQLMSNFALEVKRLESALPIYARKSDIIKTVLENKVSVVLGETGSGKSTQMLQYLSEDHLAGNGIIVCTQPRKVAAISLARRVADEMGCRVGGLVGYHAGMQACHGPKTRLIFATDHALLSECIKDHLFVKYSCIVVDEAHERSIYTDLLLGFLKMALICREDLKVVITSATIDPEIFVRYFRLGSFVPPVLSISGRVFPVDVMYETASEDYVTAAWEKALVVHKNEPPGDILVFLSSPAETEKACRKIQDHVGTDEVLVLELHGRLQVQDQQRVFEPVQPPVRKIVFATNCAETSVTIPGIKYVIDTGRVREISYDPSKNMSTLKLTWVNKSSAEQRKGRAGRTDCGKCYRLYTKDQYDCEMQQGSVPEILRVHLGQAVLKLASLGVSNPADFDFVESPSADAIKGAIAVLRDLSAFDDDGITEVGRMLAKFTLEPRLAKAVLLGLEQRIGYETVIMAVVTAAGGSIFFRVGTDDQKQEADRKKTQFCDQWGDIVTLINVYQDWDRLPESKRRPWCVANSINGKSMRIARETLNEILKTLKHDLKIIVHKKLSSRTDVGYQLAKIIFDCYSANLCRFSGHQRSGFCLARMPDVALQLHPSSAFNYMENLPKWVVYEQVLTTTRTFMLNTTFVDEAWILEKVAKHKLPSDLYCNVERYVLETCGTFGIGGTCVDKLLSKKAQELKQLEDSLQFSPDGHPGRAILDVAASCGTITLFATKSVKESALQKISSYTAEMRKLLLNETIEEPICKGSPVRFILESGGKIRTIMMLLESRQVKISGVSDQFSDEQKLRHLLCFYGDVETIKLTDDTQAIPQPFQAQKVWGFVTFKSPESVKTMLQDKRLLPFDIELCRHQFNASYRSEKYRVKVQVCRRQQRDFGFAKFRSIADASFAAANVTSLVIERNVMSFYDMHYAVLTMILDAKNPHQTFIRKIPYWASADMIKTALEKRLEPDDVQIQELSIAREKAPSELESAELFTDFCQLVRLYLLEGSDFTPSDFELQPIPPKEKSCYMTAYVIFRDAYQARVALERLSGMRMGRARAEVSIELNASFFLPPDIYRLLNSAIASETRKLEEDSRGKLSVRMLERKNGGGLIQLDACDLESLKDGKAQMDSIINGLRMESDAKNFSYLRNANGKQFQDQLQKETNVILRLDERQQAIFIHGQQKSAEEARERLSAYLTIDSNETVIEVPLRGCGYPNGLLKVLVVKYGSNLEHLRTACCASFMELNLRKHTIQVQGTEQTLQKFKDLLQEEASKIPGGITTKNSSPDCPLCFAPVDYNSCYVIESCGHIYCKECIAGLVGNALNNSTIPIQCAAENCGKDFSIRDCKNLIDNLRKLFQTSVRVFVQDNHDKFGFCITPSCPMVYRKAEKDGEEFFCSECRISLCTACAVPYHYGESCDVHRFLQGEDNDIKKWLSEDLYSRSLCPKCKMGIEKNGGCMHVECRACHAHICWRCKKVFKDSTQCYNHLAKCGGIFDADPN